MKSATTCTTGNTASATATPTTASTSWSWCAAAPPTHVHDGVKSHIESGDVYLIPPGEPHYYANARQLGIYNVLFTGDFFAGLLAEFPGAPDIEAYLGLSGGALPEGHRADVRRFDPELFFRITALLDEIVEEETQELSGARLMILSNALKILTLICRHARKSAERNIGSAGYRIASLVKTLEADFAGEWSLRRMAEHTGFSVACFRRQFRRIIGEPPVAWLLSLRLEKAAMMLQTGDGSIAETAEACGFPRQQLFHADVPPQIRRHAPRLPPRPPAPNRRRRRSLT